MTYENNDYVPSGNDVASTPESGLEKCFSPEFSVEIARAAANWAKKGPRAVVVDPRSLPVLPAYVRDALPIDPNSARQVDPASIPVRPCVDFDKLRRQ